MGRCASWRRVSFAGWWSVTDPVRLLVATPVDGIPQAAKVSYGHAVAVGRLLASSGVETLIPDMALMAYPSDLVRARSRAVTQARLKKATHVLWLDDDNIPKAGAIEAMIQSGHDFIGCPYPRKRIHWERFQDPGNWAADEPERIAYDYAYHHSDGPAGRQSVAVVDGCLPVRRLSMGCMLTSVRALDAMWEHYKPELWFTDVVDGGHWPCVALFQLMMGETTKQHGTPFRALFSEDYSFCERYARMNEARPELGFGPLQMLVSHPADHAGMYLFRGMSEGLVYAQ